MLNLLRASITTVLSLLAMTACAFDGKMMKDYLESAGAGKRLLVSGYIDGVDDVLGITSTTRSMIGCETVIVSLDQKNAIVLKYLHANPEKWHYGGSAIVEDALSTAFPCVSYRNRVARFQHAVEEDKQRKVQAEALQSCEALRQSLEQTCRNPNATKRAPAK